MQQQKVLKTNPDYVAVISPQSAEYDDWLAQWGKPLRPGYMLIAEMRKNKSTVVYAVPCTVFNSLYESNGNYWFDGHEIYVLKSLMTETYNYVVQALTAITANDNRPL